MKARIVNTLWLFLQGMLASCLTVIMALVVYGVGFANAPNTTTDIVKVVSEKVISNVPVAPPTVENNIYTNTTTGTAIGTNGYANQIGVTTINKAGLIPLNSIKASNIPALGSVTLNYEKVTVLGGGRIAQKTTDSENLFANTVKLRHPGYGGGRNAVG